MESVEKAGMKRLTLTPHFEPEEVVVLEAFEKELAEGLRLFEEEEKAEEEKKRLEEEQKRLEEEKKRQEEEKEAAEKLRSKEKKNKEDSKKMDIDKDKGKAPMESEPPAYVLKMQADIETQKIRQDDMEVKVDTVVENQKDIASKLDAPIALMSRKP
ncbi:hypothetical protein A2U01_0029208 [Trifolium medium]|uniref:Uncharacterized protein n=1 Tax=Trifolium medium TaxID=97028 RepID=A0A392PB81_9FABA|nr:hypothetical protein [Trifolium medium]